MASKHCNDVSSGALVSFECDECERTFTTKQGRTRHKTVTHKKENVKREEMLKRARSVAEKTNICNFICEFCSYNSRSTWALKAHVNHKHKEPTSPNEKKPKMSPESKMIRMLSSEIVNDIVSKVVPNTIEEEETVNKKTTIEPTKDFLTNTAKTLAEMLDNMADKIYDGDEMEETEELENRLDILRGVKPRNKKNVFDDELENTLITLPLKDVEDLRFKIRNLEEVNEGFIDKLKGVEEIQNKLRCLEKANVQLAQKLKHITENNKKEEPTENEAEHIVIEMETNDEEEDIEQLVRNKEKGYTRSNPQSDSQKKVNNHVYDCLGCEKKFNKREHMMSHQKTHEVTCTFCDKRFKTERKLQEHTKYEHDEMICHVQCGRGTCIMNMAGNNPTKETSLKCNFCERTFPSKNALATHRSDVHRTFKPCRDIINCQYQTGCFFSHIPVPLGKVRCYQCGEEFNSTNTMMIHRKIHGEVQECRKMINNQCDRGEHCWWKHSNKKQVFQKEKENLVPPLQKTQQMMNQPIPMIQEQEKSNQILVKMLKTMDIELKKIKEMLNIQ